MRKIPDVFILIAPYFDEISVVNCVSEMRRQGIAVNLVGITSGLINGTRGVLIQPDISLTQTKKIVFNKRQMLILSGGSESAASLLTDPRVHQFMWNVLDAKGYIASMAHVSHLILETGTISPKNVKHWLRQGEMKTSTFVQQLIDKLHQH